VSTPTTVEYVWANLFVVLHVELRGHLSGTDEVSADVIVGGQYTIHDAVEGLRACV
jgi:hypothetical protein